MVVEAFTVTVDDFDIQNPRDHGLHKSTVRLIHRPSGAVGESNDLLGKRKRRTKSAFHDAISSVEFQRWLDIQITKRNIKAPLKILHPLKVEVSEYDATNK